MPPTTKQPLARSLDRLQPRYDVVVIGSGYGGGVTAARLARAGKRVCVLERGREFPTGSFPSKFPELRAELQVRGKLVRTGPETALYDVRLGDDMHVLVGCGLGGGSLVNAGVALRPDARVFADTVWPDAIRQDGRLENKRLFCELGSDGMTIDNRGNVYLTGKGVTVFNSTGKKIEHIDIEEPWTANVCFGGRDRKTLFITASKSVLRSRPPKQTFAVHGSWMSMCSIFFPLASKTVTPLPVK